MIFNIFINSTENYLKVKIILPINFNKISYFGSTL